MASQTEIWAALRQVHLLRFNARSGSATGWDGTGNGTVAVSEWSPEVIIFEEAGSWQPSGSQRSSVRFTNVFRWSKISDSLRLEHLRFGHAHPVFLFDMAGGEDGVWKNISPHLCSEDTYSASMKINRQELTIAWSVQGPEKSEAIEYTYW